MKNRCSSGFKITQLPNYPFTKFFDLLNFLRVSVPPWWIFDNLACLPIAQGESLMKAVRFHEFGGPEVLKYADVPDIKPRKDQVLVRVKACALNHLDLFIRKGLPGVKLPHINGSDVSGDIAEVGEYITDLKAGQRVLLAPMTFCGVCPKCTEGEQNFCPQFSVLGYLNDGGNCEYIAVPRVDRK